MHPNQAEIDAAIKRRDDWIESLPIDQRIKARDYQYELEQRSKVHADGMMGVITDELGRLRGALLEHLSEVKGIADEHVSELATALAIDQARFKK